MATKIWAIGVMLLCNIFISASQLLWKAGSENLSLKITDLISNIPLMIGIVLFGIAGILMILALKGGDASVIYPLISINYVIVAFFSNYFFNEPLTMYKMIGISIIIVGVIFITSQRNVSLNPSPLEVSG
ncbi:MAG: EamA family transporter [Candidatus Woesearchaeota archaeon]